MGNRASETEKDLVQGKAKELLEKVTEPEGFARGLQALLRLASDGQRQSSYRTIVPQMGENYGTPIPVLRIIASELGKFGQRNPDQIFPILGLLWNNGSFEERTVVAKSLEKVGKGDWGRSLQLIRSFIGDISDWAICDQLAMFGMKPLITGHPTGGLPLCRNWAQDDNKWIRRFGAVALYSLTKDKKYQLGRREFLILELLMEDRDKDVKKAVAWILREMSKKESQMAFEFLVSHAEGGCKDTRWIVREGSKKLPGEDRERLLSLL